MFADGEMLCFECYDRREAYEERAAIMEYDGGLSRNEAERLASENKGL